MSILYCYILLTTPSYSLPLFTFTFFFLFSPIFFTFSLLYDDRLSMYFFGFKSLTVKLDRRYFIYSYFYLIYYINQSLHCLLILPSSMSICSYHTHFYTLSLITLSVSPHLLELSSTTLFRFSSYHTSFLCECPLLFPIYNSYFPSLHCFILFPLSLFLPLLPFA